MCEGQAYIVQASCSPKLSIICSSVNYSFCSSSRLEVSLCAGLGVTAYLDFLTSAILTPKSNIADECVRTDSPTLKQQGKRVVCDPPAGTGQAQVGVTLVLGLGNGSGSPVVLFHGARDHGPKPIPLFRAAGEGTTSGACRYCAPRSEILSPRT